MRRPTFKQELILLAVVSLISGIGIAADHYFKQTKPTPEIRYKLKNCLFFRNARSCSQ